MLQEDFLIYFTPQLERYVGDLPCSIHICLVCNAQTSS